MKRDANLPLYDADIARVEQVAHVSGLTPGRAARRMFEIGLRWAELNPAAFLEMPDKAKRSRP